MGNFEYSAAVLTNLRTIELTTRTLSDDLGPGYVRVKVLSTGICGSDLATYRGSHPYKKPPAVLGHELCGLVEHIGSGVDLLHPGDLVCAAAYSACGRCDVCRTGATNLCESKLSPGHGGWDGSFAEYTVLHQSMVYKLPPKTAIDAGAMVEPLSIALHALRLVSNLDGRTMAVLGAGSIGLSSVLLAEQLGIRSTICVDIGPAKNELTSAAGAEHYVDATTDTAVRGIREIYETGVDVTVVATGYPGVIDDACDVTRPGGHIIVASYFGGPQAVDLNYLVRREHKVLFSALSTAQDFADVIAWISDGSLDPTQLITHRFAITESAAALATLDGAVPNTGAVGKIMLYPTRTGEIA